MCTGTRSGPWSVGILHNRLALQKLHADFTITPVRGKKKTDRDWEKRKCVNTKQLEASCRLQKMCLLDGTPRTHCSPPPPPSKASTLALHSVSSLEWFSAGLLAPSSTVLRFQALCHSATASNQASICSEPKPLPMWERRAGRNPLICWPAFFREPCLLLLHWFQIRAVDYSQSSHLQKAWLVLAWTVRHKSNLR